MKKYKIICLMGEAGSGKDTIMQKVLRHCEGKLHEIVSCTSRPPREGEKDGVNYHFLDKESFIKKIDSNDMIEYTYFNNWFYGTDYDSLDPNKINIGVFNPEGIRKLRNRHDIDLKIFWIQATPKNRMIRQLEREEDPDVYEIVRRFNADTKDFSKIDFPFRCLCNNTVYEKMAAVAIIFEAVDNFE